MADLALPESHNNMQKEAKINSHRESALQDELEKGGTSFTLPIEHEGTLERYTETSVFQMLSPLIFNMKIFGLYFVRHYPEKSSCSGAVSYCTKCPTRSQVYATVCLVICWTTVIPYLINFTFEDRFGTNVVYKILPVCCTTFASVNATVLYIAFHRADWLPEFFIYWDGLHGDVSKDRSKYIRKRLLASLVLTWIILLVSMAYSIYMLIFTAATDDMMFAFLPKDSPFKHILKYVLIVQTLIMLSAWLLPMFLMSGIFEGLYREFLKLNKDISSIFDDKTALGCDISAIRLRHQNICTLVEKADRSLNLLLANSFLMHVAIICIMMYMAVSEEHDFFPQGIRTYVACWMIWSILYLGLSTVGGALVNSQVNMFMSRLSGAPIGLTALNIFVVDKPTVLALLGLLVTYFVVLLQFNTSIIAPSCDCTEACAVDANMTM